MKLTYLAFFGLVFAFFSFMGLVLGFSDFANRIDKISSKVCEPQMVSSVKAG